MTLGIRLLSLSETKMNVWRAFKKVSEETGKQAVGYTAFTKLWQQFHPDLLIAKPMTDLCLTCQQNTSKLLWSVFTDSNCLGNAVSCDVYCTTWEFRENKDGRLRLMCLTSMNT